MCRVVSRLFFPVNRQQSITRPKFKECFGGIFIANPDFAHCFSLGLPLKMSV
jgi:hypothetical protein